MGNAIFSFGFARVTEVGHIQHLNSTGQFILHVLFQMTAILNDKMYHLVYAFLKCDPEVRHRLLDWLGSCMHANAGKKML